MLKKLNHPLIVFFLFQRAPLLRRIVSSLTNVNIFDGFDVVVVVVVVIIEPHEVVGLDLGTAQKIIHAHYRD